MHTAAGVAQFGSAVQVIFSINFMEFSRGIPALEAVFFDSLWNSVGTLLLGRPPDVVVVCFGWHDFK